jgi:8-amino-7-oxononanoate synthase
MTAFPRHAQALAALADRGRLRTLAPRLGHDFASNDYLGLAGSDVLRNAARAALDRGVAVGAGGSRLLRGNDAEHEALEALAALHFGTDRALFMGGGFAANQAIFASLPMPDDLVLYDALIHASAHDGMRLGRAETQPFAHNDANDAQAQITAWRAKGGKGRVWLAIESLYSMGGDFAPLADFAALATAQDAVLVVDEAHATGLYGPTGRGLTEGMGSAANLLTLHTCGKALGVSGALICGAASLIDTLINKARGFIYATAPSPLNAALVAAALAHLDANPQRRLAALALVNHAHQQAAHHGFAGFNSQILPVLLGTDQRVMQTAATLQQRGYDIRGIRPPTVPRGTARLRISITLNTSADVITEMFADLAEVSA